MNMTPSSSVQFGLVIPGRVVLTEFQAVGPNQFVVNVPHPQEVTDVTFFLLPTSPVPLHSSAVLYFSVPPHQNWQVLGSIDTIKPSAMLRTSWPSNPELQGQSIVQLGISIEDQSAVNNLGIATSGLEERKSFAHKIALDLFKYMSSFGTGSDNMMMVPTDIFTRWMERFESKYKRDPNFMMKLE